MVRLLCPCHRRQNTSAGVTPLTLQNGRSGERVESVLTEASSRLRGDLLRNLIITGLALHTTAPELPRLLASMPVPPTSVSELQALVQQMAGTAAVSRAAAAVPIRRQHLPCRCPGRIPGK